MQCSAMFFFLLFCRVAGLFSLLQAQCCVVLCCVVLSSVTQAWCYEDCAGAMFYRFIVV